MLSAARRELFKALHNSTMEMLHINVAFWSVYSHFGTLLASRPQPGVYYLDEFTQTHQKTTLDFDCVDLTATNAVPHYRKLNENPRTSFFFRGKKKIFVILTWIVLLLKHLKMKQKITQKTQKPMLINHLYTDTEAVLHSSFRPLDSFYAQVCWFQIGSLVETISAFWLCFFTVNKSNLASDRWSCVTTELLPNCTKLM